MNRRRRRSLAIPVGGFLYWLTNRQQATWKRAVLHVPPQQKKGETDFAGEGSKYVYSFAHGTCSFSLHLAHAPSVCPSAFQLPRLCVLAPTADGGREIGPSLESFSLRRVRTNQILLILLILWGRPSSWI